VGVDGHTPSPGISTARVGSSGWITVSKCRSSSAAREPERRSAVTPRRCWRRRGAGASRSPRSARRPGSAGRTPSGSGSHPLPSSHPARNASGSRPPVPTPPPEQRRRVGLRLRDARDRVGNLTAWPLATPLDDSFHLTDLAEGRPVEVAIEQVGGPQSSGLDPVAMPVQRPVLGELPRGVLALARGKKPRPRPGWARRRCRAGVRAGRLSPR
jgi:hypothetical protein